MENFCKSLSFVLHSGVCVCIFHKVFACGALKSLKFLFFWLVLYEHFATVVDAVLS